jgi:hypothetical protein
MFMIQRGLLVLLLAAFTAAEASAQTVTASRIELGAANGFSSWKMTIQPGFSAIVTEHDCPLAINPSSGNRRTFLPHSNGMIVNGNDVVANADPNNHCNLSLIFFPTSPNDGMHKVSAS